MSTILIISPEPWEGHFVSKHHYARELTRRGHSVIFYGPPADVSPMRLVPVTEAAGALRVLEAPRVAPGIRFLPRLARRALEERWLSQVETLAAARVDVVWNFENSRFYDLGFAGNRLKIYQQVDLAQNFHPNIAASTADLVIALSAPIAARLKPSASHLIRLTHGYADYSCSGNLPEGVAARFSSGARNAVLVGNLDIPYLDVPLIEQLVANHDDVQFHFIGGYSCKSKLYTATAAYSNVVFWGRQPAQTLPKFLVRADLLLLAYLADQHLEQLANPHKLMEYLGSGRAVLASRTLDYENRLELIEMATDRADYAKRFAAIMANPEVWNCPERISARRAFASENTYSHQIDRIAKALGPHGALIA